MLAVTAIALAGSTAAGAPLVDLLHAVPTTVRVSSRVANAAILPAHLVDGDFDTAWNSATGDLAGAWIEVSVPPGAVIEELRMTVGHTGHGPKHEDYFTMNPRIWSVEVVQGNALLARPNLSMNSRDLQTIAVHATGTIRIRMLDVEVGSKPAWRETCVSELQVWGTAPRATSTKRFAPTVVVALPAATETHVHPFLRGLRAGLIEHERSNADARSFASIDLSGTDGAKSRALVLAAFEAALHLELDESATEARIDGPDAIPIRNDRDVAEAQRRLAQFWAPMEHERSTRQCESEGCPETRCLAQTVDAYGTLNMVANDLVAGVPDDAATLEDNGEELGEVLAVACSRGLGLESAGGETLRRLAKLAGR